MSNLMDELMAEMNRVNNLETEVNKTVEQLSNESGLARQEKLKEICQFLLRMTGLLIQAKVIKPANSSSCRYYSATVNTGIRFQRKTPTNDAPWHSLKLEIRGDAVNVKYLQESSEETLIWKGKPYGYLTDCTECLVDQWSQATYDTVENQIAEIIKKAIAKRIEDATQKLKTANETHEKYYGKEV